MSRGPILPAPPACPMPIEPVAIRWGHFPFVRPALAAMAGIALYEAGLRDWPSAVVGLTGALLGAMIFWVAAHRGFLPSAPFARVLTGLGLLLTCAALSALWAALRDESRRPDHLLRLPADVRAWQGVVSEGTTRKPGYTTTTVRIQRVKLPDGRWLAVTGSVKLLVRRDTAGAGTLDHAVPLPYGSVVLVNGPFKRVAGPPNPGQFDYATYLRYRRVWHEQFVSPGSYAIVGHETLNPIKAWSLRTAATLAATLNRYVPAPRERGLLTALVLGLTDDLDADLKTAYGATGTTHVLAVSGLHIALVFGLVIRLLGGRRWEQRRPGWRALTLVAVLSVCWGYALITGLSASVLRAVVMATFVAVGRALGKRISLFNTLAVAALFLLWLDPQSLFDVGFQLSFLAVLSIALLQPRLARRWQPEAWLPRQVWAGVTVAVAAQVGTFPLTLYYFHQVPTQFLIANLVAVPWSNGLLYTAFGLLGLAGLKAMLAAVGVPVAWLGAALDWLGRALSGATYGLNEMMTAIGHLPGAVITGIALTGGQLALLFGVLIAGLLWLHSKRRSWLLTAVALVALYVGTRLNGLFTAAREQTLIVYSVRRHAAVGLLDGLRATVLTDSAVWADSSAGLSGLRANLLPHLWGRGSKTIRWAPGLAPANPDRALPAGVVGRALPDGNRLLAWHGLRLLVLQRPLEVRPMAGAGLLKVDFVLIRGRPRVVPSALARAVACRWVVLDGSGPAGWARYRTQELRAAGFRCHDVGTAGAFIRRAE